MIASIDKCIVGRSKSSASERGRRTLAQALLLTATLLLMVGLVALWLAHSQPVFAGTPSNTAAGASQNGKVPTAPECDPDWVVVRSANVGSLNNELYGAVAVSANDVWAVGLYNSGSAYRTLIERWNGIGWSVVSSPDVGTNYYVLYAVDAVSANDVWAVGYYDNGPTNRTLIERWNGSAWNVVPSPNASAGNNHIVAVSAVSANDVWAVGYYYESISVVRTLTMHWNGIEWAVVSSPNVSSTLTKFRGVTAISANDVWAVGFYEYDGSVYRTFTEHWDGVEWTVVGSPNVGTSVNVLDGVTAVSANDVWAVGFYQDDESPQRTLILRWNGSVWGVISSPSVGAYASFLGGVTAISANDVWAVGDYVLTDGQGSQSLIEHWNGSEWTVVTSPNVDSSSKLYAVTAAAANDVWAAGSRYAEFTDSTLVERYNPCTDCAIEFTDVPEGSTFYDFVRCMACQGIINGYTSGCETGNPCFRPNNNVTRGQLSKIVSNAAGFSEPAGAQQFEDVPPGSTFYDFVWRLADRGHVGGYTCGGAGEPCVPPSNLPYFRPNGNASRGQISKIVSNSAGFSDPPGAQLFEDVPPSHTFHDFVQRLANLAVMGGYPCGGPGEPCVAPGNLPYFRPASNATRGQTSKIVANAFFPNCNIP